MLVAASKMRMFLTSPAWRNWRTRWTQNPVAARPCGFEPLRRQSPLGVGRWALDVRCSKTLIKIGDTSGLRVRLRRKQRPHGLTREHDNRKDAENCSRGKEEA